MERMNINGTRVAILIVLISLWSVAIAWKLVRVQVVEHDNYVKMANERQQGRRVIKAFRGTIWDSGMNVLASDESVKNVVLEPRNVTDVPGTAKRLASILGGDAGALALKIAEYRADPRRHGYMVVARRIDDAQSAAIGAWMKELKEKGRKARDKSGAMVYFEEEVVRSYPNDELACHALGFVNRQPEPRVDDNGDVLKDESGKILTTDVLKGGAGVELQYDRELRGRDGVSYFDQDAKQRGYKVNVARPAVQGNSLVLTIDKHIQYVADRELAAGAESAGARAGTAIVMDVETGRILALSNYPRFDGNRLDQANAGKLRNSAVTSPYEPGSTFKVSVVAAAVEAGVARPGDMIDCENGVYTYAKRTFHDDHRYGLLSVREVLEKSSNIGAAKLGFRLGPQRLYDALHKFGFGAKTGVDLPGEASGKMLDWRKKEPSLIGTVAFGQAVSVTSMQTVTAVNAIANGGVLMRPYVVERVISADGGLKRHYAPRPVPVVSRATADAVADMMEGVVLRGTAKNVAIGGYRVAGKTGTAQKFERGRLARGKYVASFVGFAPRPQPKVTVLVQLDEPRTSIYGGTVSAPIFQKIVQAALMRLNVPPDASAPQLPRQPVAENDVKDSIPAAVPDAAWAAFAEGDLDRPDDRLDGPALADGVPGIVMVGVDAGVVVPDFRGMSKRKVSEVCMDMGVEVKFSGTGLAMAQNPAPGARVVRGAVWSVTFAKAGGGHAPAAAKRDVARATAVGDRIHAEVRERRGRGGELP
ncbi:MAG: transpeptidase family protein [Acidobacteriota bacterium]|jgi:cell division protein FtsI (penicillin-binding protein 3)|nr:transpeptidase family protein [Acidobacteriota bacterium]